MRNNVRLFFVIVGFIGFGSGLSLGVYSAIKNIRLFEQSQVASVESVLEKAVDPSMVDNSKMNNVGRAPFGLFSPKFQCEDFLRSLRRVKNLNISTLFNTFGNDFGCAKKILQDPRLRNFEIHLINEVCARNRRCGPYEFMSGLSPDKFTDLLKGKNPALKKKFDRYVSPLQDLLAGHLQSGTECQISFGLESNVNNLRAIRTAIAWSKEAFPQCKMVWNPIKPSTQDERRRVGADYLEAHGDQPALSAPCIANNDGTIIPTNKMQDYIDSYAYCKMTTLWILPDNCWGATDIQPDFIDPRSRSCDSREQNSPVANEIIKAEKKKNPYEKPLNDKWTAAELKSLVGCKTILPSQDGEKKGFLLKQSSDHPGIVVLLPGTPLKKGQPNEGNAKTGVFIHKGKKLFSLKYVAIFTEDNYRNRPILRTNNVENRKLVDLPFHTVLSIDDGKTCRRLENPKVRND